MPELPRSDELPHSPEADAARLRIAVEVWQSYIRSFWLRNSFFAALEILALGAAWKIRPDRAVFAVAAAGLTLALTWFLNNLRTSFEIRQWWRAIQVIEMRDPGAFSLTQAYESHIHKAPFPGFALSDRTIGDLLPAIFVLLWIWLMVIAHTTAATDTPRTQLQLPANAGPALTAPAGNATDIAASHPVQTTNPPQSSETHAATSAASPASTENPGHSTPASAQASASPSAAAPGADQGPSLSDLFRGLSRLIAPSIFSGPGTAYAVDREGNSYPIPDLIAEGEIRTERSTLPDSGWSRIPDREIDRAIELNQLGDLASRVLFVVKRAAAQTRVGDVQFKVSGPVKETADADALSQAVSKALLGSPRGQALAKLRVFAVAESISTRRVTLAFPETNPAVLNQAFAELAALGSDTFVKQSPTSIQAISRLPLVLAQRAVEVRPGNSARNLQTPRLVTVDFTPVSEDRANELRPAATLPEPRLLPSTHFVVPAPSQLASVAPHATYGQILNELRKKIEAAGIDQTSIHESGFGFAIATRLEVTQADGTPLPGGDRFLSVRRTGKRMRGYYITVDAHPTGTARVTTSRPQELFNVGDPNVFHSLPKHMELVPVEPGTSIKVFVLEFQSGAEIANGQCGSSAVIHMTQSGLLQP
jgi:hypothetical protein